MTTQVNHAWRDLSEARRIADENNRIIDELAKITRETNQERIERKQAEQDKIENAAPLSDGNDVS